MRTSLNSWQTGWYGKSLVEDVHGGQYIGKRQSDTQWIASDWHKLPVKGDLPGEHDGWWGKGGARHPDAKDRGNGKGASSLSK